MMGFFLRTRQTALVVVSTLVTALLAAALVFATLPAAAFASNSAGNPIRLGFFQFDGYHQIDENGAKSGYGYDLMHLMRPYTNWDFEYIGYDKSWAQSQAMLAGGTIDILTSAQKTPERMELFDFSERPVGTSSTMLTVRAGDNRYSIDDYSTLNGIRVGMVSGSTRNNDFAQYAQDHGFTYTPVYFYSLDDMKEALQEGSEIDAILTSNLRTVENEFVLDQFNASDFYVMVKKGNQELLDQVNYAISQLDSVNPQWRSELWSEYYTPETGKEINFTPREQAYLEQLVTDGTVLNVLVNPDKIPYAYLNNGKDVGIIPDIFEEIASRLGIRYKYLTANSMEEYLQLKKRS